MKTYNEAFAEIVLSDEDISHLKSTAAALKKQFLGKRDVPDGP